jgi:hypothetical protein
LPGAPGKFFRAGQLMPSARRHCRLMANGNLLAHARNRSLAESESPAGTTLATFWSGQNAP